MVLLNALELHHWQCHSFHLWHWSLYCISQSGCRSQQQSVLVVLVGSRIRWFHVKWWWKLQAVLPCLCSASISVFSHTLKFMVEGNLVLCSRLSSAVMFPPLRNYFVLCIYSFEKSKEIDWYFFPHTFTACLIAFTAKPFEVIVQKMGSVSRD